MARNHPDDSHHAAVLVLQQVTVIEEVARHAASKIDQYADAGVGARPRPERNLHRIEVLPLIRREGCAIASGQLEMNLVDMELVHFARAVLDRPFLDRALRGDYGRGAVGLKARGVAPSTVMKYFD